MKPLLRYGQWAGDIKGTGEKFDRCVIEVWPRDSRMIPYQCHRRRGYGPSGEYCKQHAKKKEEAEG